MKSKEINNLLSRRKGANVLDTYKEKTKGETSTNYNKLVARRNKARSELIQWRDLLNKAYHYAVPNYNVFDDYLENDVFRRLSPGKNLGADVYDLTLVIAHQRLVNKMLTGLVPKSQQWVRMKPGDVFGDPDTDTYKKGAEATEMLTERFFKYLDRSNFYLAVSESLSDTVISTGIMAFNEGVRGNPFRFEAASPNQVMLEGDALDGFSAVFRDWMKVRVDQLKMLWPNLKRMPPDKKMDDTVNIYEMAIVNYDADNPSERYRYIVMTTTKDVLLDETHPSWPWIIFRMRKLAGEVRGRGPSLDAWCSAATINEAIGDELMSAAFQANPMYMADTDSVFNQDSFVARPGAIIPVNLGMGGVPIQPLMQSGNPQFMALVVGDLRQQINELMFQFPLGPTDAPDSTATEANIRYTENLESFMAIVPRLQSEFFDPMIKRALFIMNKIHPEIFDGIDEDTREKILTADGEVVGLSYETPLMTARGQSKTQKMLNFYNSLAAMVGPEAATASLRSTKLPQLLAENAGADLGAIKDESQLQQELAAAAEAMIQQQTGETVNVESSQAV